LDGSSMERDSVKVDEGNRVYAVGTASDAVLIDDSDEDDDLNTLPMGRVLVKNEPNFSSQVSRELVRAVGGVVEKKRDTREDDVETEDDEDDEL